MATVSGLRPVQRDRVQRSSGASSGERVQVNGPQGTPGLSPAAAPTFNYGGPEANNASALADALSSLNPALQRFAQVEKAHEDDELPGKLARALTGKPLDEQGRIIKDTPEFQSRLAQNLGSQMVAQATADAHVENFRNGVLSGDIAPDTNIDEHFTPIINEDMGSNNNPHFAEAYRARLLPALASIRNEQAKYNATVLGQRQDELITGSLKATLGQALDNDASPEEAYAALRQTFSTVKAVANRPFASQEALLVQHLGQMADTLKTDHDYARKAHLIEGILNTERVDPVTGQKLGSLLSSPTLGGDAAKVLHAARGAFNTRDEFDNYQDMAAIHEMAKSADPAFKSTLDAAIKLHPERFTAAELVGLTGTYDTSMARQQAALRVQDVKDGAVSNAMQAARSGKLWAVDDVQYTNATGTEATFKGDAIRKEAISRFEENLDTQYANDPQGRFNAQVQFYSGNLVKNEGWEKLLKGAPFSASNVVAAGGDLPANLTQGLDLYMNLRAKAPQLLQQHVGDQAQDFFEIARVAQQYHSLDAKQALMTAARATTDPNWSKASPGLSKQDTVRAVRSSLGTMWGKDLTDVWNADSPQTEVVEDAMMLNRGLGIPMADAIKEASERVKQNYQIINGTAVRTGDKNVPPNFGELAGRYVDKFYDTNAAALRKEGFAKSDLHIVNIGDTPNWAITFRGHPAPLEFSGANFSLPNLYTEQTQIDETKHAAAGEKLRQAIERKGEPWLVIGNPDKGGLVVGGGPPDTHTIGSPANKRDTEALMQAARRKYQRQNQNTKTGNVGIQQFDPTPKM